MKFIRRPANLPIFCAVLGCVGMLLRFWQLKTGIDEKGLLTDHPATLLCVGLCVLAAGLVVFALLGKGDSRKASGMFPPSIPGALTTLAAGVLMALTGVSSFSGADSLLLKAAGIMGLLSGAACVLLALCRWKGLRAHTILRSIVCVFFMLHLVQHYQQWFSQPQLALYAFQLLAHVGLMLVAYQRAALDAGADGRKAFILSSQLTGFLCLLALPGSDEILFYVVMAAWMFLDTGKLRLPKVKEQEQEAA